ncbi:MAG: phage tail spike protein [Christensenellaceae bacterium]|nr:phage tail spike protein [Christensenellaceae bacterium]
MICVYLPDCTDFSTNGLGPVSPSSCTVTETLNGEWELTLEHPLDAQGKWRRLIEGNILRAPVPAASTPQVRLAPQTGGGMIYRISTSRDPLRLRSGTGTKYKILAKYKKGTEVIVLNKTSASWYEVSCPDGKRGYMSAQYLTYVRTEPTPASAGKTLIEPRQLRDQPFRIYRAVPELTKITIYARHVFYDLMDNMLKSYKPAANVTGAAVVQNISSKCLTEHDFEFYSDLDSTADEVEIENVNPVDALLGEGGVVEKYGGELARDWFDAFVVKRVGTDTDVQIREGKNLLGISYDVDLTDVVTRIMPTGEDADGNVLYLPELYIDSPNIGSYVHPKWIHLPVSEAREVTKGDNKKTKAQCYTELRKAAQAEYDKGCDLPSVTLKVDFINCAETEEYRQYKALQNIFLGDAVRVIARRIGVAVSMRLTQYIYDCLTRKYTAMTLGTVADTPEGNMISSRQLASGLISGAKLGINSVGMGQLKDGSVGSLQIGLAAIQTAHIEVAAIVNALIADAAITRAKIEEATIGTLNADALTAISARIHELAAENITTDALYAALATIATAQITTANIDHANISWADIGGLAAQMASIAVAQINTANINQASIEWASIASLNTRIAQVALAQITHANIESAHIDWANIADLNAAVAHIAVAQLTTAHLHEAHIDWAGITALNATIAQMVNASIGSADIDWARIKDLTAGTAIIERGVNGKLYVADLAVTEANMASLTVGELIVRGSDGCFYAVTIAADGSIITEKKSVTGSDVADESLPGGKLMDKTITARELNVQSIFADEALVRAIRASNLDVDDLFAHTAFIAKLQTVDITGNEALRLYVEGEVSTAKDEALDAVGDAVSQITLTAEAIRSEVSRDYASADALGQLHETLSTLAEQTENNFTWAVSKVTEIEKDLSEGQEATAEQIALIKTYMTFGDDGLTIGKSGNPITIRVINDRVAFFMNNTEVAYLSNNKLYVTQAEVLARLQIGKFAFEPQTNGNLSMIYTG